MIVYIPQNHSNRFFFLGFQWEVGFIQAVRERVNGARQLTNDVAIKVFEQIRSRSGLLFLLTNCIFLISSSVILIALGTYISPVQKTALLTQLAVIARMLIRFLGGFIGGFFIENSFNGFLPALQDAYFAQYLQALVYLDRIKVENSQGREVTFLLP